MNRRCEANGSPQTQWFHPAPDGDRRTYNPNTERLHPASDHGHGFNVYIGQRCPSASIKSNIVLSLNANLRNRITSIDQHPIKAVVFIDECFIILRSGRQPIFSGLDCHTATGPATFLRFRHLQTAAADGRARRSRLRPPVSGRRIERIGRS